MNRYVSQFINSNFVPGVPGLAPLSLLYTLCSYYIIFIFSLVITGIDSDWSLGTLGTVNSVWNHHVFYETSLEKIGVLGA
jgi:hypothetical protein